MNATIIYIIMTGMFLIVLVAGIRYAIATDKLRQDGDIVQGRIIEHEIMEPYMQGRGGIVRHYILWFSFDYQGNSYTENKRVSKETYQAFKDGDTIRVRCLPDPRLPDHPVMAEAVDF